MIANELIGTDTKIFLITSDQKLYNAAKDESLFETFHFWTCNLGCGHQNHIPAKGAKDRQRENFECKKCGTNTLIRSEFISTNTCPICGNHCSECNYENCVSTYILNL
ncbi:oxygen-sensitive ribonucleoside-triphosphate reductase [Candidatus Scalindua japonica]|uniref:Oxygen-sensitive ribonucleoside-triphosphate reductase n=1 Tax=Candidatus Scalindua japonica TaxID=1284222 RepID=A0A286U2K2_9BACT|nr:oxygen-sensitive ribonucleoside-triphosphate reductase [Candidatus Scalindua japonica]